MSFLIVQNLSINSFQQHKLKNINKIKRYIFFSKFTFTNHFFKKIKNIDFFRITLRSLTQIRNQFNQNNTRNIKQQPRVLTNEINNRPNHYNLTTPQSGGFKFSKSVRKELNQPNPIPEPGAYDPNTSVIQPNPPSIKFSKAQEQEKSPLDIGPGTYNWNDLRKSPAFTFQNKFENQRFDILNTPGPGHYDVKESHSLQPNNKGFIIKSINLFIIQLIKNYEIVFIIKSFQIVQILSFKKKILILRYTTSNRINMLLSNGPGPGSYNLEILQRQNSIKFPKQLRIIDKVDTTPGPGAFLTMISSKQGVSFGKKLQTQSEKQYVPGPGTYKLKSFANKKPKKPKNKYAQLKKVMKILMRPQYLRRQFQLRQGFNALKQGISHQNQEVSENKQLSKYKSFGKAERRTMQEKSEQTPGPGSYYLGASLSKMGSIIGKSSKELLVIHDSLPGPGKYNLNESISRGPSYHIAGKYEKQQEQSLLGPGRYQINRDTFELLKFGYILNYLFDCVKK